MYDNKRLFLVFEYLELDLKKYMDTTPALAQNKHLIKVKEALDKTYVYAVKYVYTRIENLLQCLEKK